MQRDGVDQLGAQLGGQLRQLAFGQLAQVGGNADLVQQRRFGRLRSLVLSSLLSAVRLNAEICAASRGM